METMEERIRRVASERVDIVEYDGRWVGLFEEEKRHLLACLPSELVVRIEHFGSTSVPGLAAKPVVDVAVEVTDLEQTRQWIVPILEAQGYEYFWRPSTDDESGPWYAWFIKRGPNGERTHHIHMLEKHFSFWEALLFRDYLREHPDTAREYAELKRHLAREYPNDREMYTKSKGAFIRPVTESARALYGRSS